MTNSMVRQMVVKNKSNSLICIHDLGIDIGPNETVNLGKRVTADRIKNSVGLQTALDNGWLVGVHAGSNFLQNEIEKLDFFQGMGSGKKNVDFIWDGLVMDMCGYGCVSRNITYKLAMDKYKFCIKNPVMFDNHTDYLDKHQMAIMKQLSGMQYDSNVYIYNRSLVTYKVLTQKKKYKIAYTVTESKGLSECVVDRAKIANEIWVPNSMDVDNFKEAGFNRVFKVTQGTNPDLYNEDVYPDVDLHNQCKGFVFLACGENAYRKGYDVLIKAYCKRFTNKDDVTLIIMSHGIDLAKYYKDFNINKSKAPHIIVYRGLLKESQVPRIYACADVFVLSTRGEGWLLPANDMGAMGKPSIVTNYGGQLEYLNEDNSWLVDVNKFGKDRILNRMDPLYADIKTFPIFGTKFINDFADKMFYAYNNRDEVKSKGQKLKENVLENYTWDNTADQIKYRLSELPVSDFQVQIRKPKTIKRRKTDSSKPKIVVYMRGGIGDLVKWTAIYRGIRKKFGDCNYMLYTRVDNDIISHLDFTSITKVSENFMRSFNVDADVIISLSNLPYMVFKNDKFKDLKAEWNTTMAKYSLGKAVDEGWAGRELVRYDRNKVTLFSDMLNLNVSDRDMSVNITNYNMKYDDYVVISCGADAMGKGVLQTKVWPKEYWEELVSKFNVPVIQIGASSDYVVKGAINFIGRTSVSEACSVVKNSKFLIATDGAMIHIAEALGKTAVVLWGPTVKDVFGYNSQINIVAKNHDCIFTKYFPDKCKLGTRICMESIQPNFVYKTIKGKKLI